MRGNVATIVESILLACKNLKPAQNGSLVLRRTQFSFPKSWRRFVCELVLFFEDDFVTSGKIIIRSIENAILVAQERAANGYNTHVLIKY